MNGQRWTMGKMPPHVIGLDLSMTSSGVCLFSLDYETEGLKVTTRAITSKPAPVAERTPNVRARRLDDIVKTIRRDVAVVRPDLACVESPVPNRRMKSAMLLERGAVYWMTLAMLDYHGVEIVEVAPRERALYATGDGDADKVSVAASMVAEHGREFATDDECDAFVLALIAARLLGTPLDESTDYRDKITANLAAKRGRS